MSVLIPGMEMPTSCCECQFSVHDLCSLTKKDAEDWFVTRPEYCPLIPVPEHGDLIDRKVALDSLLNGMVMTGYQSRAMDCVGEWYVPTIIPADKEGEG